MRKMRGLTLIELLVTVTVVAILLALGVPSFVRMIKSNAMAGAVNTFLADARYARSEAMRLGGRVVLCRSDDPEGPTPACAANNSTSGGRGWATGWVIYHDKDNDSAIDPGEILRVQGPLTSIDKIEEGVASNATQFKFAPTGRLYDASMSAQLTFGGDSFDEKLKRVLCMGPSGRVRVAGDGSASCGATNE